MRIGVIGAGNVGGTLGRRFAEGGHEVRFGVRDPASPKYQPLLKAAGDHASACTVREAVEASEVILLAAPWTAIRDVLAEMGDVGGKVVIDAVNPINAEFSALEIGHTDSAGERIAAWLPGAHVVKAFNSCGFNIMAEPRFGDEAATLFYCGDDPAAKQVVAELAAELGFDPVDTGPMTQARQLEALAWLWITMAVKYGHDRNMAFKLLRRMG